MKYRKPYKMFRNQTSLYILLTIAILLLIVSTFHELTNYSLFWSQPTVKETTHLDNTTFEVLDYQQSPGRCWHGHENENLYLIYASSTDRNAIVQFLENFKPLNTCNTWILFQHDKEIEENWKERMNTSNSNIVPPARAFAMSFHQGDTYSLVDLVNRKPHGKFTIYHPDKKLFLEMDYVKGVAEGKQTVHKADYRIEKMWQNNEIISIDTIR